MLLPRSTGLAFIVNELREGEKKTGEQVYIYDTTMQFEGYSGEVCSDDNYGRTVDVNFPSFENCFWNVGGKESFSLTIIYSLCIVFEWGSRSIFLTSYLAYSCELPSSCERDSSD